MPKALSIEERAAVAAKRKAAAVARKTSPVSAAVAAVEEAPVEVVRSRATRTRRNTFNGTQGKLRVNHEIPGYHLYIFNDTPGRIDYALSVGYEFVAPDEVGGVSVNTVSRNTDLGDKVRFLVGVDNSNQPMYAYLMKQRIEFYEKDQQEVQAKNDRIDRTIRQGQLTKEGMSTDGFYIPREGIKIK